MHLQILSEEDESSSGAAGMHPSHSWGTKAACVCPGRGLMHFPSALMCMSCCLPKMTEMAQCPKTPRRIPMAIN